MNPGSNQEKPNGCSPSFEDFIMARLSRVDEYITELHWEYRESESAEVKSDILQTIGEQRGRRSMLENLLLLPVCFQ